MTTWDWKDLDYSKAQAGDIISDTSGVSYIEEVRARTKRADMITPEYHISLVEYRHEFQELGRHDGTGYSFPCYENGDFADKDISDWKSSKFATYADYVASIANNPAYRDGGIQKHTRSFNVAAVIRCSGSLKVKRGRASAKWVQCNNEVSLDYVMTNTCEKCHSDYNSGGEKLAPRSQWGWDTGESLNDILSGDFGINERAEDRAMERTLDY